MCVCVCRSFGSQMGCQLFSMGFPICEMPSVGNCPIALACTMRVRGPPDEWREVLVDTDSAFPCSVEEVEAVCRLRIKVGVISS
mgnify:CR=1 FL=1